MRHIGDRHPQLPATSRFRLTEHRIVEVSRIFTINGHKRQFAQILTTHQILFSDLAWHAIHQGVYFFSPINGYVVVPQGNTDFHIWRQLLTQDFNNFSGHMAMTFGVLKHLDDNDLTFWLLINFDRRQ